MSRVLGVDACRAGWIGVVLDDTPAEAFFGSDLAALVGGAERSGRVCVIAVDIPTGLPDRGGRMADRLARSLLRGRASSVFSTPVRSAIEEADYPTANRLSRALTGAGISRQAHALREKILDVDQYRRTVAVPLIEVHPEVSFVQMAGMVVPRQASWAGMVARRDALASEGIVLTGDLGLAGEKAGVDDVLDAGAAAWTARRFALGHAVSYPSEPEVFSDGWPSAIWA